MKTSEKRGYLENALVRSAAGCQRPRYCRARPSAVSQQSSLDLGLIVALYS